MKKLFSLISVLCVAGFGVGLLAACSEKEEEVPSDDTTVSEPEHTHSYTSSVTTEPTCTDAGVETFTCSCGDSYEVSIEALGHDYGNLVHVAADESADPAVVDHWERVCTRCGYIDIVDLGKLAESGESVDITIEVNDATDLSSAIIDGATIVLSPTVEEGEGLGEDELPTLELGTTLDISADEGEEINVTLVVDEDSAFTASDDLFDSSNYGVSKSDDEDGAPLISVGSGATVNLVLSEGSVINGAASSWGYVGASNTGGDVGKYGGLIGVKEGGTLIIDGDGAVVQELPAAAVLYVAPGGSCVINGGDFSVDNGYNYTIINDGDLTFNGGYVHSLNNRSSLIKNGDDNRADYTSTELGLGDETLTINDGTFVGGKHIISNCLSGTLTITGGVFEGCYGYNVSGSTIQNENTILVTEIIEDKSGNATISGGTFGHEATEGDPALYQYIITIDAADTDQVTDNVVTITGGTFYPGYADEVNQSGAIFNINEHGEVLISESVLNTLSTAALANVTVATEPDANGLFAITALAES